MSLDEILLTGETEPFEGAPIEETDPSCSGMVDPARKILFSGLPSLGGSESEVAQSYPTLCDPMDRSLPGSSVHGIFQARVLGRVAISLSRISSQPRDRTQVSRNAGRRYCRQTLYCLSHQGSRSAFSHSQQRPYPGPPGVLLSAVLEPRIQAREESSTVSQNPPVLSPRCGDRPRKERPMHLRHLVEEGRCSLEPRIFATVSLLGKTTTLLLGLFRVLQCSCLENPRDGGAWWAAVYGVALSRTRLK